MASSDEESDELNIFKEPDDFYVPDKSATFTTYTTLQNIDVPLRLVGSNPLWGHLLWNAGQVIARHIEKDSVNLIQDKTVLELGAGAGLPSLISAICGARQVLVTDYPDQELIDNLQYNIEHAIETKFQSRISAKGYLWGNDVTSLTGVLDEPEKLFDVLILADILFNHSEHEKLVLTLQKTLNHSPEARALVFFTPYRPWLLEKDLRFFELAKESGLQVTKLFEHVMDKVMFPEDPGDEKLRRTVFAYELTWPS